MTVGSETFYHRKVVPETDKAVSTVTDQFLKQCRLATPDRHQVRVVIDLFNIAAMEGFGVEKMMQQLKDANLTVTQVVHDKDASTMKQVMTVFEDVEEGLCLSNFFI